MSCLRAATLALPVRHRDEHLPFLQKPGDGLVALALDARTEDVADDPRRFVLTQNNFR